MNLKDTIVAPATAAGTGSIDIIRISGPDSLRIIKKYFQPTGSPGSADFVSRRLYHGMLIDSEKNPVDEVMAVYMASPHTYTCDDIVEIHCHGSRQIVKQILALLQRDNVRLAAPGEFTYRAFMNGRIDLPQAEAVARLIRSHSDSSRRLALSQASGALSRKINAYVDQIKEALVFLEAWIDFPEEDLPPEDVSIIADKMEKLLADADLLCQSYDYGRLQTEGASILLVGRPNVGKSSLLNALLGENRAIVTSLAGTTRDLLEEGVSIEGLPVRLVDTAGLRETEDPVEIEGVLRAKNKIEHADLVLLLLDSSRDVSEADNYAYQQCVGRPTFVVLNKIDLGEDAFGATVFDLPTFRVSAKFDRGTDRLKKAVSSFLMGDSGAIGDSVLLSERRHFDTLIRARQSLLNFVGLLEEGETLDLLTFELRDALLHLGQITGETTTEDLLDDIFSGFCIGK